LFRFFEQNMKAISAHPAMQAWQYTLSSQDATHDSLSASPALLTNPNVSKVALLIFSASLCRDADASSLSGEPSKFWLRVICSSVARTGVSSSSIASSSIDFDGDRSCDCTTTSTGSSEYTFLPKASLAQAFCLNSLPNLLPASLSMSFFLPRLRRRCSSCNCRRPINVSNRSICVLADWSSHSSQETTSYLYCISAARAHFEK
jgi:hypothetical protein